TAGESDAAARRSAAPATALRTAPGPRHGDRRRRVLVRSSTAGYPFARASKHRGRHPLGGIVHHLALDERHALVRGEDTARQLELVRTRCEDLVHRLDLPGMDDPLPVVAVPERDLGGVPQAFEITQVGVRPVYRLQVICVRGDGDACERVVEGPGPDGQL